jgi:hypothetical protein
MYDAGRGDAICNCKRAEREREANNDAAEGEWNVGGGEDARSIPFRAESLASSVVGCV